MGTTPPPVGQDCSMGSADGPVEHEPVIIHADVDAFYASIEQRDDRLLRNRPIAVGGRPERRGVIMTASYEARRFGVHSAMPSRTAMQLCPELTIVPARFAAYQAASSAIMQIFEARASIVEPLSLDEAYLDLSGRAASFTEAEGQARKIKEDVLVATGLTVSLGIASTKLVAKVASDFRKPDGLTVVAPSQARAFLAPLPLRRLWGIGPKTEARFRGVGIELAGQLADADEDWVVQRLGPWALGWQLLARAQDSRVVAPRGPAKRISREVTFERDTTDGALLRATIFEMAAGLADAMTNERARTVHIKIRRSDFRTLTRQERTTSSVGNREEIRAAAIRLLEGAWDGKPIRLVGIGVSNFVVRSHNQLSLFQELP